MHDLSINISNNPIYYTNNNLVFVFHDLPGYDFCFRHKKNKEIITVRILLDNVKLYF